MKKKICDILFTLMLPLTALLVSGCVQAVLVASAIEEKQLRDRMKDLNTETNWEKSNAPGDRAHVAELGLKAVTEFKGTYKDGELKEEEVITYEEFDQSGNRTELILQDEMFGIFGYIGFYDDRGRLIERQARIKKGKMHDGVGDFTQKVLPSLKKQLQEEEIFRQTFYYYSNPDETAPTSQFAPDAEETIAVYRRLDDDGKLIRETVHKVNRERGGSELLARTQYEYDQTGRLIQVDTYSAEEENILNEIYKYDGDSDIVLEKKSWHRKTLSTEIREYKGGRISKLQSQAPQFQMRTDYIYDERNRLVEFTVATEVQGEKKETRTIITYNEDGLQTGSKSYQKDQLYQGKRLVYHYFDEA